MGGGVGLLICLIKYCWINILLDMARVSSTWASYGWRLLDRMGFSHAHPYFFMIVWFRRKGHEALIYVSIMGHVSSNGDVGGGECHESQYPRISNGGLSLSGNEEFSWCFGIPSNDMQVGETS
jgi:hypothetical protein